MDDYSRSILCIGNDDGTQELIANVLAGNELTFAQSALDAVRLLHAQAFHAFILDYWLPDWAGPALCREIRTVDPHAPVVFCSAAASDAYRTRALRAGATAYLCKPIDPEELRSSLRVHLNVSLVESLRARHEEELAVQAELERQTRELQLRAENARNLAAQSAERMARARAYKAFIEAHGTRAHFEGWWPNVFASAWANQEVAKER
jgi:DNA-binding response OmpR family regulator